MLSTSFFAILAHEDRCLIMATQGVTKVDQEVTSMHRLSSENYEGNISIGTDVEDEPWKRFPGAIQASCVMRQFAPQIKRKALENSYEHVRTEKADTSCTVGTQFELLETQIPKLQKGSHHKMKSTYADLLPIPLLSTFGVSTSSFQQVVKNGSMEAGEAKKVTRHGKEIQVAEGCAKSIISFEAQSSSFNKNTIQAEESVEFELCVLLLKKYGVLEEGVCASISPSICAPHPGCVGDGGFESKLCMVCRLPEGAKNTVICDECQEIFHLSCCVPRLSLKFFEREDDWYCLSCKKQKKKSTMNGIESCPVTANRIGRTGKAASFVKRHNSKVRLGQAHQVDVPLWTGSVEDAELECCFADQPGMEVPLSNEEIDAEKDHLWAAFNQRVLTCNWLPAKMLPHGMPENWLQCRNIVIGAYKDAHGVEHDEIVCGKWRRAPLGVKQAESWECFCVMKWDPLHADCAVPQELPTPEILQRMQVKLEGHGTKVFMCCEDA